MKMPGYPTTEECKRIEYLVNNDERLKKVASDFITRNVALVDYIDEVYGEALSFQIVNWCSFQSVLHLKRLEEESSDGN